MKNYYCNLLDSVLFNSPFSGHTLIKMDFDHFEMSKSLKKIYSDKYKSFFKEMGRENLNDYFEEFTIAYIIPELLDKLNESEAESKIVCSLNQIADNKALINDLRMTTGKEDVVEIIERYFNENKIILSTYDDFLSSKKHTIISYIYNSLLSALYRINDNEKSDKAKASINFISSLFYNLGSASFSKRTKPEKNHLLLSTFSKACEKLLNNIQKVEMSEKEFIKEIDAVITDYLKDNKNNAPLGYITAIKYIMIFGKIPEDQQKKSIKILESQAPSSTNTSSNKEKYNSFFSIIDSLWIVEEASKNKIINNIPFIFKYEYTGDEKILPIYENDQIFVKSLMALLNAKEGLFNEKIKMFTDVLDFSSDAADLKEAVTEFVHSYLKNMVTNLKGGRSDFIKKINEIKNYRGTTSDSDPKTIFMEELKKNPVISKELDNKGNKKKSLYVAICNIIIEIINVAYNIGYTILTSSDKLMLEADGSLESNQHQQFIYTITKVVKREYSIENGKLIVQNGERLL